MEVKTKDDFLMSPTVDYCFKELLAYPEIRKGFAEFFLMIFSLIQFAPITIARGLSFLGSWETSILIAGVSRSATMLDCPS